MTPQVERPSDSGLTLIEMVITIMVLGLIGSVLGMSIAVVARNEGPTTKRIGGANTTLAAANVFPADVMSTPPGGRDNTSTESGCASDDRGDVVINLTWTEQSTTYRVSYQHNLATEELYRVHCRGPDPLTLGNGGANRVGALVTDVTLTAGGGALLGDLDSDDITLEVQLATDPPTTVEIRGIRQNYPDDLPLPAGFVSTSALHVRTTTTATEYTTEGEIIAFESLVFNTGNTVIDSIVLTDPAAPGPITCPGTQLGPGTSMTCTFSHSVTQDDLDDGSFTSVTQATGESSDSTIGTVSGTSPSLTPPGVQSPAMSVTKTSPTTEFLMAGDVIDYTLEITNTGNVTLVDVTPTDPKADATPVGCTFPDTPGELRPDATADCSYTYTVQPGDVGVGEVNTFATVTAATKLGDPVVATSNSVPVPFQADPNVDVTMVADQTTYGDVGDISYTVTVTNTGNVTLSGITAVGTSAPTDNLAVTCPSSTLSSGHVMTCDASHPIDPSEAVVDGEVTAWVEITGTPPSGPGDNVIRTSNEATVAYATGPAISVTKRVVAVKGVVGANTYQEAGDVITYELTVRNTGTVDLTDIDVSDPNADESPLASCDAATLATTASYNCTVDHTVTTGEQGNPIANTAMVVTAEIGTPVSSNTITVNFLPNPQINVDLQADKDTFSTVGEPITYTMTIENTGNVNLTAVGIGDQTLAGATAPTCSGADPLPPTATVTCESTYTVAKSDSNSGATNAVTARAMFGPLIVGAVSSSVTVTSQVLCDVDTVAASPNSVGRDPNQTLAAPVTVTVTTIGTCSGLRLRYYPQGTGVIAALNQSGSSFTYTIPDSGKGASKWDAGLADVDVLPATTNDAYNDDPFQPFTVT